MTGISEPAFERLIKLMQVTTSGTDGEILSAIKMANVFLKKADYNWEDLLRSKVVTFPNNTPDLKKPGGGRITNAAKIEGYFDAIQNQGINGGFADFIQSDTSFGRPTAI